MRGILLFCLLASVGCIPDAPVSPDYFTNPPLPALEVPQIGIPVVLRKENWLGPANEGSCVHATMVSLFHRMNRPDLAHLWENKYGDGEYADSTFNPDQNLVQKMEVEDIPYAYVVNGDVEFLEWACRTGRGCGVTVNGGSHMVLLAHLDDEWAGLIDNNSTEEIIWVQRNRFIAEWKNSMGWAVTPVFTPVPPKPRS